MIFTFIDDFNSKLELGLTLELLLVHNTHIFLLHAIIKKTTHSTLNTLRFYTLLPDVPSQRKKDNAKRPTP